MTFTLATFNTRDLFDDVAPHVIGELDRKEYASAKQAQARQLLDVKLQAISEVVVRADADILCLQEVKGERVLNLLCDRIGDRIRPYSTRVVGGTSDPRGIRVGVLSRFALVRSVHRHIQDGLALPEVIEGSLGLQGIRFRRGLLEVVLSLPDGLSLTLLVAHLKSHRPLFFEDPHRQADLGKALVRSTMLRLAEALRIREILDKHLIQDPRKLLAVAGDFNEEEDSLVYKVMCGSQSEGERLALRTPAMISCTAQVPGAMRFTMIFRGRKVLFDHILVSPELWRRFQEVRILNEKLSEDGAHSSLKPTFSPHSDHAPVICRFY